MTVRAEVCCWLPKQSDARTAHPELPTTGTKCLSTGRLEEPEDQDQQQRPRLGRSTCCCRALLQFGGFQARQLGDKAASLQSQAEKDLGEAAARTFFFTV